MATTQRRKLDLRKQLPYTFAGDPRERGFITDGAAFSAAISHVTQAYDSHDGEEYRHGIFDLDRKVGVVIRETDGTITIRREER